MAGRGVLPLDLLAAAKTGGWEVQFLSFIDRPDTGNTPVRRIEIAKPLDIVLAIRRFKSTHICMAGGVVVSDKGREGFFKALKPAKPRSRTAGDTGLSKLGKALELATGAKLIGVHEIMPELLAGKGLIAGPKPDRLLAAAGHFAIETAIAAGALDLGQAVVCSGHRVVAVEDIAGTDALLQRVGEFRRRGLVGDGSTALVLAKAKKPNQPMFADLPAIGPDTIDTANTAGIGAIFVEAGRSILIDRKTLAARAQKHGITVYGHSAGK